LLQEAQSGGTPAALLTGDAGQFAALEQRGLLAAVTWDSLGADASLPQTATMIATTSALGVLVWNRANVSDAEAPKSLDDLLQPRFAGKLGSWIRAPLYASLAKRQGVDKVAAWLTNLLGQQPKLYDSTYRLAQDVGTGEIDVGYGLYHATLPAIAAGAPIGMALTEPVAISTLFSAVVNRGANTEGARLLAAWLATPKGANAYEAGTGRGNPYVAGSKTGDYVKGHVLSEYPVGELAAYVKTLTEFNKMLSSRGARK